MRFYWRRLKASRFPFNCNEKENAAGVTVCVYSYRSKKGSFVIYLTICANESRIITRAAEKQSRNPVTIYIITGSWVREYATIAKIGNVRCVSEHCARSIIPSIVRLSCGRFYDVQCRQASSFVIQINSIHKMDHALSLLRVSFFFLLITDKNYSIEEENYLCKIYISFVKLLFRWWT